MNNLDQIQEGEVYAAYCTSNHLFSRIIRIFVKGKTHVEFVYQKNGRIETCGANTSGIFPMAIEHWMLVHKYRFELIKIEGVTADQLIEITRASWGKKYGTVDLFKHALYKIFGVWLFTDDEETAEVCSEFFVRRLHKLGIWEGIEAFKANPEDVYQYHKSIL